MEPNAANPSEPRPIRGVFVAVAGLTALVVLLALMMFDASFSLSSSTRLLVWCLVLPLLAAAFIVVRRRGIGRVSRTSLLDVSAFVLLLAAVVAVPSAGGHLRRALAPWTERPATAPVFRIVVSSKDVESAPGTSVALGGYLVRIGPNGELPQIVDLQLEDETRPLLVDADGSFAATVPTRTGTYRFALGTTTSERYRIDCRNAIVLLPGSKRCWIRPKYAQVNLQAFGTTTDLSPGEQSPMTVLAGSRCEWTLHVSTNAVELEARWLAPGNEGVPIRTEVREPGVVFVETTPRSGGTVEVAMKLADGSVGRLQFPVAVVADMPPSALAARGWRTAAKIEAKPGDRVEFFLNLSDDVAVMQAVVELRSDGDEAPTIVPLVFPGLGTPSAGGRVSFALPTGGGTVRARLAIEDGAPTPQRLLLPAIGFVEFTPTPQARSTAETMIERDREEWERSLTALDANLRTADRDRDRRREAEATIAGLSADYANGLEFATPLRTLEECRLAVSSAAADLDAATFVGDAARIDAARETLQDLLRSWSSRTPEIRSTVEGITARRLAAAALVLEAAAWPKERMTAEAGAATRLQLEGRIAQHLVLRQAVAAAAAAERATATRRLFALEADHRAWWTELREIQLQERMRLAEGLLVDLRRLVPNAERLRTSAAASGRILGLPLPAVDWVEPIDRALRTARGFESLTELEKAAAEWDRAAGRFNESISARSDPKEALRQLLAALDDLSRRRADRANADDTEEVARLLDFYGDFDRRPGWDERPLRLLFTRLREQAPEASIVEATREAIRRIAMEQNAMPSAEQRRITEAADWTAWKTELVRRLRTVEAGGDLVVPMRTDLSPHARHALERLATRANEERRESMPVDAAITLRELLRRSEAIVERPDAKATADDLLLEAAHRQVMVCSEPAPQLAGQREINALLAASALVATSRAYPEVWEACRIAEDSLRLGRPSVAADLNAARERLHFLASKRIGAITDRTLLARLRLQIPNLTGMDARARRQRMSEAVAELRFGREAEAKAALLARLERGPATNESEKRFQTELAILFADAEASLARNRRAEVAEALHGPPPPNECSRLTRRSKPGLLPDLSLVRELQDVAESLRRLRDVVGTRLDDGVHPPIGETLIKRWEDLRREAEELTATISRLVDQLTPGDAEEANRRAVLASMQSLVELWQPIRVGSAVQRTATAEQLSATSRDLLMRAKFRAATGANAIDQRSTEVGNALREASEALAKGDAAKAHDAVRRACARMLRD